LIGLKHSEFSTILEDTPVAQWFYTLHIKH